MIIPGAELVQARHLYKMVAHSTLRISKIMFEIFIYFLNLTTAVDVCRQISLTDLITNFTAHACRIPSYRPT